MRDGLRRAANAMTSVVATSYLTWPPAIHKNIVTQVCTLFYKIKNLHDIWSLLSKECDPCLLVFRANIKIAPIPGAFVSWAASLIKHRTVDLLRPLLLICINDYWVIQAGLLTPLTFAWHHLTPMAAFTSGVCFLHRNEGSDGNFANFTLPTLKAFSRPIVRMCLATSNNLFVL